MSNQKFNTKLSSDIGQARSSFERSSGILKTARNLLHPAEFSDEEKNVLINLRKTSSKLISLLEHGLTAESIDSIDKETHNVVRECLKLQQTTLKFRINKVK